jgi:hypothetical protein
MIIGINTEWFGWKAYNKVHWTINFPGFKPLLGLTFAILSDIHKVLKINNKIIMGF